MSNLEQKVKILNAEAKYLNSQPNDFAPPIYVELYHCKRCNIFDFFLGDITTKCNKCNRFLERIKTVASPKYQ